MPYKNAEKRKEKSRDAARSRRGKEADVFAELSSLVPVQDELVAAMDKASVMRLAISSLKLRTLMSERKLEEQESSDADMNRHYMKSLGGFLLLLDEGGDIMYASEDVTKILGLNQLDLLGASLFEFTHPCDHEELQDIMSERDAQEDCKAREHMFFLRHKCTLTSKGRNVNLKSASYKVIRYTGHHLTSERSCLVLIGEAIPQPHQLGVPLDSFCFMSQHSMDLRFTYCDERIQELLGYAPEDIVGQPLYELHHAWDGEAIEKSYKNLFSKGQMWTDRYRLLASGGGFVWAETQATVIYNHKTEKPQCILCLHYVLSAVEDAGCIMSHIQLGKDQYVPNIKREPSLSPSASNSSTPSPSSMHNKSCTESSRKSGRPARKMAKLSIPERPVGDNSGPVLSTETTFVPTLTKDMGTTVPTHGTYDIEQMETDILDMLESYDSYLNLDQYDMSPLLNLEGTNAMELDSDNLFQLLTSDPADDTPSVAIDQENTYAILAPAQADFNTVLNFDLDNTYDIIKIDDQEISMF